MYERLKDICAERNTTITYICEKVTGNKGNLQTWKKGYMRSDWLSKTADMLNVSTDYILGRTDTPNQQIINNNTTVSGTQANSISNYGAEGIEIDIINKMKNMTDTQKAELYLTACKLTEKE